MRSVRHTAAARACRQLVMLVAACCCFQGLADEFQIVFSAPGVDASADIWIVNTDGTGLRNLTSHPVREASPQVSPNGKLITFLRRANWGYDLFRMGIDGSGVRRLTERFSIWEGEFAWSPDGRELTFSARSEKTGNTEIFVVRRDGRNRRRLTDLPSTKFQPRWSPDGARIAFLSHTGKGIHVRSRLSVINPDGSGLRTWPFDRVGIFYSWAPDGKSIAFSESTRHPTRPGNHVLLAMEDATVHTLTQAAGLTRLDPTWSPDGRFLAYRGIPGIWRLHADGSEEIQLTTVQSECSAGWSPDGRWIAFVEEGGRNMYVVSHDGSELRKVVHLDEGHIANPVWVSAR